MINRQRYIHVYVCEYSYSPVCTGDSAFGREKGREKGKKEENEGKRNVNSGIFIS